MISDLDLATPAPLDALTAGQITTGAVYAVDVAGRLVQVGMPGGTALWLPALPGRYDTAAGLARVLLSATGRPIQVLGPVNPVAPATLATVTAVAGTTVTVTWAGAATQLPALPSTYTTESAAWVDLDDWGVPYRVTGPSTLTVPTPPPAPEPPPGPSTIQVTQQITAQWSGSWRSSAGAWDRWNTGRYGGRSTLYQGAGFGSGPMRGLAVYGDQLTNLGALSIDRVQVMLRSVGLSGTSGPITVQGSPHGTQPAGAPVSSGPTASGGSGGPGDGWVDLPPAMYADILSGVVRGLAAVGPQYWAVAGSESGDGMALLVTYTRPV